MSCVRLEVLLIWSFWWRLVALERSCRSFFKQKRLLCNALTLNIEFRCALFIFNAAGPPYRLSYYKFRHFVLMLAHMSKVILHFMRPFTALQTIVNPCMHCNNIRNPLRWLSPFSTLYCIWVKGTPLESSTTLFFTIKPNLSWNVCMLFNLRLGFWFGTQEHYITSDLWGP